VAVLCAVDVEKRFGSCVAVSRANLRVEPGRIHAVVGENGAGKSTLLRVMAGQLVPEAGHVEIDGKRLAPHSAAEAIARGVGMVAQHFQLIDALTVLENTILGVEPTGVFGILDLAAAEAKLTGVLKDLGVKLDVRARVRELGVGDRQRLEIARVLYRDARVVILDEPTAVLTPKEAAQLYETLHRLAEGGRAVVVVTHKLDEVATHARAVTVLRRGRVVASRELGETPHAEELRQLTQDVMGDAGTAPTRRAHPARGEPLLELRAIERKPELRSISLEVHAGEILGVAGVEGSGQSELVRLLAGLLAPRAGRMEAKAQISVLHGDRHAEGLVLDASLRDNLLLGELEHYVRGGLLDASRMEAEASERLGRSGAVPRDLELPAQALSGGNQQKLVVERAMSRAAKILVLAHPTRGVDVGAARAIHRKILEAAEKGVGILVFGADLDELRALCDRIVVLARGSIVGEVPADADNERIGALMLTEATS
jgi:general nucleoside transport system ATP-binding protein